MNKIRVIVCEDIKGIRKHIVSALNADEEIEVVGEAESGKECIELTRRVETDIILMDIQMEYETAGIDAIREICEEKPGVKIIVLTAYEDVYKRQPMRSAVQIRILFPLRRHTARMTAAR